MKTAGVEFSEKRIALSTDQTKTQLKPYFSDYKVPVLMDKDRMIWDSLAILEYVAENYTDSMGWPTDPTARGVARSVSAEMHSSFFALRSELPMNCRKRYDTFSISSDVKKDIDRIKKVWRYCKQKFSQQGPWLFGNFCIADAMFAPVCFRFYTYNVSLIGFERDYVETMLSHPHIVEWKEAAQKEKEILEAFEVVQ